MPRYKLTIEYDGTPFVGWQIQAAGASVQGELCSAIERFSGETVTVAGAGRTDSGVHAIGQAAHIDLTEDWPADKVRDAVNSHLRPNPIVVIACRKVDATFDARFSATARHYRYRILPRRARPALDDNRVWWVPRDLDVWAMNEAAQALVGHHDFTTFRATGCQAKSPVKTLDGLDAFERDGEIWIEASARSFLHNQVRSMAGALKAVGEGRWQVGDVARALEARDRTACAAVAPACGLYLIKVDYPANNQRRDANP
jgi:tRNA pseudouridine38-40 synthase